MNTKRLYTALNLAAGVNDRFRSTSTADLAGAYFVSQMPKRTAKTDLYRLIEAGYLARQSLLEPLSRLGLAAGDDAVLLCLAEGDDAGLAISELASATGYGDAALVERLERLAEFDQIERCVFGPDLTPAARLTENGRESADIIIAHWHRLDDALMDELKPSARKRMRKMLKRFVALLSL